MGWYLGTSVVNALFMDIIVDAPFLSVPPTHPLSGARRAPWRTGLGLVSVGLQGRLKKMWVSEPVYGLVSWYKRCRCSLSGYFCRCSFPELEEDVGFWAGIWAGILVEALSREVAFVGALFLNTIVAVAFLRLPPTHPPSGALRAPWRTGLGLLSVGLQGGLMGLRVSRTIFRLFWLQLSFAILGFQTWPILSPFGVSAIPSETGLGILSVGLLSELMWLWVSWMMYDMVSGKVRCHFWFQNIIRPTPFERPPRDPSEDTGPGLLSVGKRCAASVLHWVIHHRSHVPFSSSTIIYSILDTGRHMAWNSHWHHKAIMPEKEE